MELKEVNKLNASCVQEAHNIDDKAKEYIKTLKEKSVLEDFVLSVKNNFYRAEVFNEKTETLEIVCDFSKEIIYWNELTRITSALFTDFDEDKGYSPKVKYLFKYVYKDIKDHGSYMRMLLGIVPSK